MKTKSMSGYLMGVQSRMETVYRNARIVCGDETIFGSLQIKSGRIDSIDAGSSMNSRGIDCDGDLLIPGLVELHTDNLEKNIQPRPGVIWPSMLASALAHDIQVAGAGITTVFDAIALGGTRSESLRSQILSDSLEAIAMGNREGLFKVDHRVHLRCEISDEHMEMMLSRYGSNKEVSLLSVMDHTPGQRQWSDLEKWRLYHRDKKWADKELQEILDDLANRQERYAEKHRRKAVDFAREHGLPLASHDDTTEEDCLSAARDGVRIAEFPTTLEAARKVREHRIAVLMGAPNAIRGQSHSGNVSTRTLAGLGLLDGLSSDYVPASLLHAAFILADDRQITLERTIAMVTSNPAAMVGLHDRGKIEPGRRADLVRVRAVKGIPIVRGVWREGRQVI